MSEVDAGLRNERLTFETDLDLLKEETSLELEVEMEERLNNFRVRKEEEVATQLERQLDKREEIMRNKALIDVRKRETHIRAEIEAQLGLKRAEIRTRLQSLSEKMDAFKEMAEDKMRDAITGQIEGEINVEESDLKTRESEFRDLQSTDTRAEKRQMWMQSISGQGPAQTANTMNPSALGARPDALGSSGGRPMRGILEGQQQAPQSRMGLGGMRTPMTSSKPLQPLTGVPLAKPVKAPLGGGLSQQLPQPVQKLVRKPLSPVTSPLAETQMEQAPEPVSEPVPEPVTEPEMDIETVVEEPTVEETVTESIAEESVEGEDSPQMSATMRPITAVLEAHEAPEPVKTTTLTARPPQLIPKKKRGSPPQSKAGEMPTTVSTTTLKPVQKLTPLKLTKTSADESEDIDEDSDE
jgi:hypothetical protein